MALNLPFPTIPGTGTNSDPNAIWQNLDAIVAFLNTPGPGVTNPGVFAIPGTPFVGAYGSFLNVSADGSTPLPCPFLVGFPNALLLGPFISPVAASGNAAAGYFVNPYNVTKNGFTLLVSGGSPGSVLPSLSYLALGN